MMVTFVSQCEKNALKKTRRVLDAFANRIGDNTWQTVITQEGLLTVKKLLRKTASKSTAVSCHWIRSRARSELLWVVGNKRKFNSEGFVPVNYTEVSAEQYEDDAQWQTLEVIKYAAAVAGLFHDFGKANTLFQTKLNPNKKSKRSRVYEPFRHEWVSMRLFQAFVGTKTDAEWLTALSEIERNCSPVCFRDGIDGEMGDGHPMNHPFNNLPPFGQLVAWLILTHHKLPLNPGWIDTYKGETPELKHEQDWLETNLSPVWNSPKCRDQEESVRLSDNWNVEGKLPYESEKWRARACELASEAKVVLRPVLPVTTEWVNSQLFTSHISRLCLMLADHFYSSKPLSEVEEKWRSTKYQVFANTEKVGNRVDLKQQLDEHLIGVAHHAAEIAKALPHLNRSLLQLGDVNSIEEQVRKNKELSKKEKEKFGWQDDAVNATEKLAKDTLKQGFFGINMASTGKGKTLGNAKIIYTLGQHTGRARFSVALGLRTLTLQTGKEYRDRLSLNEEQLAIMVGGLAVRQLFENEQTPKPSTASNNEQEDNEDSSESTGSESKDELLDSEIYLDYRGNCKHSLSKWTRRKTKDGVAGGSPLDRLISAPVLVCTIDHLIPATEGTKGGKQIGPMLRLLSSELVIDEPDDFGLEDLPALCRLVHWAGLLGSRVLLSTATMPPALAYALFQSYQAGWSQFAKANIPDWDQQIVCAWFDEFSSFSGNGTQKDFDAFRKTHDKFVTRRVRQLEQNGVAKRKGTILPIDESKETALKRLSCAIYEGLLALHENNNQTRAGKRISIGLVRMANIDPLVAVAKHLLRRGAPDNTEIHYCVYHSHFPLAARHTIETKLDRILKRKDAEAVWHYSEISTKLRKSPKNNHLFVVLASPVAEVGRDHDYDWAIVEPSSMRSIVQLAGRVLRHRELAEQHNLPNIGLLDKNFKALNGQRICFEKPGFEYRTNGPRMSEGKQSLTSILYPAEYETIDARNRVSSPKYNAKATEFCNLIHLEHRALAYSLFNKTEEGSPLGANVWWKGNSFWCGEVQRQQRFRKSEPDEAYWLLVEDAHSKPYWRWKNESVNPPKFGEGSIRIKEISKHELALGEGAGFWFDLNVTDIYSTLSVELPGIETGDLQRVSQRFGELRLIEYSNIAGQEYEYFPELGVYQKLRVKGDE